jgi:2-polyprenyl-6-hydroxyphenyl methylase/3-demethylubiquinone-9 3-methyltransferase
MAAGMSGAPSAGGAAGTRGPAAANVDPAEVARFSALAHRWWDPGSEMKPLHDINPLRVDWIERMAGGLAGREVVDVGCGGGILSEALALRGARVIGIDLSDKALGVARLHQLESGVAVDYRMVSAEAFAAEAGGRFDVVTCLEMLEHVPDPASTVAACARLARPGGTVVFSTLDRNVRSYALAVLAAEYVLGMLPRGTHDWSRFLRPSELARLSRAARLDVVALAGIAYAPLTRTYRISRDTSVNYLMACRRPPADA